MENNREQKYFGYVYKLTMIPTGKIYIGKREKDRLDTSYFGDTSTKVKLHWRYVENED